jgi:hypothetical protein
MSRTIFIKLLLSVAMILAASTSSASASSWRTNGPMGFTATAPASKLRLSGATAGVDCVTTGALGILNGPTGALSTSVADIRLTFNTCRAGGFGATVSCSDTSLALHVDSYSGSVVTGHVNGGPMFCVVTVPSISGCTISVSSSTLVISTIASVTYNNTTGVMDVSRTGQALSVSWSSCGTLFSPATSPVVGTFTDASGNDLLYRVTSTPLPNIIVV